MIGIIVYLSILKGWVILEGKRALLIINPCAGSNSKRIGALEIVNKFSESDWDTDIKATRCQGDATTLVKEHGENYDLILCCGGDGTLNEVVNGLMKINKKIPVGYIPSGSTNDLAATLGIPVGLRESSELIFSGKKNTYDLGRFNNKYFTYIACFGAATDISYNTPQRMKNLLGRPAYLINGFVVRLIPMLKSFKPTHMKIEYDGGVIEDDFYYGSVSNATTIAGLMKLDDVKLNDGYLELFLVKGLKRNIDALKILKKATKKDYDGEQMVLLRTKKVKITCNEQVAWSLDGEFGGMYGNSEIEVVHNAFEIFSNNDELFCKGEENLNLNE